jgi:hypothetical protein
MPSETPVALKSPFTLTRELRNGDGDWYQGRIPLLDIVVSIFVRLVIGLEQVGYAVFVATRFSPVPHPEFLGIDFHPRPSSMPQNRWFFDHFLDFDRGSFALKNQFVFSS